MVNNLQKLLFNASLRYIPNRHLLVPIREQNMLKFLISLVYGQNIRPW
jgi:hypothetical protein